MGSPFSLPAPTDTMPKPVAKSSTATKDQILVPETLLKKRKSQEKAREQRNATIEKRKTANKEKRKAIFKRAETYVKEYRDAEREKVRLNPEPPERYPLCRGAAQACLRHPHQGYQQDRA